MVQPVQLLYDINISKPRLMQQAPYSHGQLMSRTDPDEVEVGKGPGQPKGQTPAHHDAKVGE